MNKFVFFGSSEFSVRVIDLLFHKYKMAPSLVVTTPDKPQGRKLVMTPNVVKVWAQEKNISVIDPKSLKKDAESVVERLKTEDADFFLVASYGKIIPPTIFNIPKFKTLNIHPSLLPKYRGASPMISQILNDEKEMGTTIMQIDEGMDTGPIVAQVSHLGEGKNQIPNILELEEIMARESVDLFAKTLPGYISGEIVPVPQDNSVATECGKYTKEDGLLNLDDNARKNLLKIKAFKVWPRTYFMRNEKRIVVTDAALNEQGNLKILRVIPEGKNEMPYEDFLRGQR